MDRAFTKRNLQIYLTVICILSILFLKKVLNDNVDNKGEKIEFFTSTNTGNEDFAELK